MPDSGKCRARSRPYRGSKSSRRIRRRRISTRLRMSFGRREGGFPPLGQSSTRARASPTYPSCRRPYTDQPPGTLRRIRSAAFRKSMVWRVGARPAPTARKNIAISRETIRPGRAATITLDLGRTLAIFAAILSKLLYMVRLVILPNAGRNAKKTYFRILDLYTSYAAVKAIRGLNPPLGG